MASPYQRKVAAADPGSALSAIEISVPLSRTPSTASASASRSIRPASRKSTALRAAGGWRDQRPSSNAARAAAQARATSAAEALAMVVSSRPSIGDSTGIGASCPSPQVPPISSRPGATESAAKRSMSA